MNERINPFARFQLNQASGKVSVYADATIIADAEGLERVEEENNARLTHEEFVEILTKASKQCLSEMEVELILENAVDNQNAESLFQQPRLAKLLVSLGTPEQIKEYENTVLRFHLSSEPLTALDLLGRALFESAKFDYLLHFWKEHPEPLDERYFLAALAVTNEYEEIETLDLWTADELRGSIKELEGASELDLRVRKALIAVAQVIAEERERCFLMEADIKRLRQSYKRLRCFLIRKE